MDTKRIRNVDISQIHHLPMIDFIGNDFAIFDDIKDMSLSSYPTRLNAACLTVCLKGGANWNSTCSNVKCGKVCWVLSFPTRLFCKENAPMTLLDFSLPSQKILWIW